MRHISRRAFMGALSLAGLSTALPAIAQDALTPLSPPGAILGEGPLYDARDNTLYWVDIRGKKLHALSLTDGRAKSWDVPDLIGWIVPRSHGGFMVGILRTVYALTLDPFMLTPLLSVETGLTDNRLNDAKVDAQGRLWTGTMHMPFSQKTAALYRIDPDLSVHTMDAPYLCTNGPTFSRDGTRLYHNETAEAITYVFDLAPDGSLSNKRVFATFHDEGLPDGMTTDADDGVWIAHNNGGMITRFLPDGTRDFQIPIPAKQVTSLTFGGTDFTRLFVTTAAQPPVAVDDPLAGTLFEVPASLLRGHRGLPTNAFAG